MIELIRQAGNKLVLDGHPYRLALDDGTIEDLIKREMELAPMSLVAEIDRLNREICLPPLLNEIDSLTSLDERLNLTKSAVNIGSE